MKKEVFLQHVAMYMIFLMLTVPALSSQALGQSITKVTVSGSAGIEDVMQSENDYFTASVTTSDDVDADQIYISYTKDEAFDECTGSTCTYTSSQTDRAGQEMDYTIQLINDSTVVDTVEGTILIDEEEPEVTDYEVEKEDDVITIEYEVEDTACDDCDSCAGIDYLVLLSDGEEIDQINAASQCELEDTLDTTVSELNLADGDHELCLYAVDNVGYVSDEVCEVITVDQEGPHFETGSLIVREAGTGLEVEYVGSSYVLVDVMINVTDASLSENTIRADLSGLNGVIGEDYANVSADSCDQDSDDDELWTCSWESYYIEESSGSIQLSFWGYDNEGNEGSYSPTFTLTVDDSAPQLYQVYTDSGQSGDDLFISSGAASVYVDIDPTGSAFAYNDVFMTFSKASMTNDEADDCWDNGSYWTCVWNVTVSSGTASSSMEIDATDDAGNTMETYDLRVTVDDEDPEFIDIGTSLDCPTASDTLEIVVNATEGISDELYLVFYGEDVRTDDEPIIEECDEIGDGAYTCYLTVNDFVSYPADEDVTIELMDLAGNIVDEELDIEVCELESAGEPDFVTLNVDEAGPVDLLTLSYMDVPVYVDVGFSMASGANIVAKSVSCDAASNVYFIDQNSGSSIMVMYLEQNTAVSNTTSELSVDCTMQLTMQYQDKVYSTPETEEFEVDIDVYGTPLGSIESSIQEKIDLQVAGIHDAERRINKWVTWNKILGILCKIANILTKAEAVISVIRGITTIVAYAAWGTYSTAITACGTVVGSIVGCPAAASSYSTYTAMYGFETFANSYHTFITKFVWPTGVAHLSWGSIVKYGCIIYSGRLCEGFNGLENELLTQGEYGSVEHYRKNEETSTKSGVLSGTLFADWDPYRSIHTARSCLYPDAIIYNLRKERQINCMYTTCLENTATNGLDSTLCEVEFDQRQCLYVDGAAWRAMAPDNGILHFFQLVVNTAFSNIDVILAGILYWFIPPCDGVEGWEFHLGKGGAAYFTAMRNLGPETSALPGTTMSQGAICHIASSGIALLEAEWVTDLVDWDFEAKLEGTDYCVPYGVSDANVATDDSGTYA